MKEKYICFRCGDKFNQPDVHHINNTFMDGGTYEEWEQCPICGGRTFKEINKLELTDFNEAVKLNQDNDSEYAMNEIFTLISKKYNADTKRAFNKKIKDARKLK